jgi:hypothetical protein
MKTFHGKKILIVIALSLVLLSTTASAISQTKQQTNVNTTRQQLLVSYPYATTTDEDYDPLTNIVVTVEIKEIRAYDQIDPFSDPDFYVKVFIDDTEFISPVYTNTQYVTEPNWAATQDVPDDQENVTILIQLWDKDVGFDKQCDIARDTQEGIKRDIQLMYNIRTGHWYGDDYTDNEPTWADPSGYGRANGCDDNTIYENDRDCELVFDIYQNDYDGDGIPYWTEVNVYGTDPEVDDRGTDTDCDGVPLEWEHKWGYTASWWGFGWVYMDDHWENQSALDPDEDGLDNIEEYKTSQWGSDPFRKDIFLELDQMEIGPNGEGHLVPLLSEHLLQDSFGKHNIVFHIDDGCMGGGEILPFDDNTTDDEMQQIYWDHFLQGDSNNWRLGVFHYGLVLYHSARYPGFVWNGGVAPVLDSLQISTDHHDAIASKSPFYMFLRHKTFDVDQKRAYIYASAIMHETGHTLGIFGDNTPGCDCQDGKYPWQKNFWIYGNYVSVMNYRYIYGNLVDYSNGSHGRNDWDDWSRIDLQFFQRLLW